MTPGGSRSCARFFRCRITEPFARSTSPFPSFEYAKTFNWVIGMFCNLVNSNLSSRSSFFRLWRCVVPAMGVITASNLVKFSSKLFLSCVGLPIIMLKFLLNSNTFSMHSIYLISGGVPLSAICRSATKRPLVGLHSSKQLHTLVSPPVDLLSPPHW